MRKSLYTLLALIMINSSTAVKPIDHLVLDYGQRVVVTHPGIGPCEWSYDGQDFYVIYEAETYLVDPLYIDTELVGISKKNLLRFLSCGYLYINRLDNGEFTIKAKGRLNGGVILFLIAAGGLAVKLMSSSKQPEYDDGLNHFERAMARNEAIEAARVEANSAQAKNERPTKDCLDPKGCIMPEIMKKLEKENELDPRNVIIKGSDAMVHVNTVDENELDLDNSTLADEHCLVGPGIPKLIPLPGIKRLPMMKMVRPTEPLPILPGKTFIV